MKKNVSLFFKRKPMGPYKYKDKEDQLRVTVKPICMQWRNWYNHKKNVVLSWENGIFQSPIK
jgi:hypothetical protein